MEEIAPGGAEFAGLGVAVRDSPKEEALKIGPAGDGGGWLRGGVTIALLTAAPFFPTWLEKGIFNFTDAQDYLAYASYGLVYGAAWPAWSLLAWYGMFGWGGMWRRVSFCAVATAVCSFVWWKFGKSGFEYDEYRLFFEVLFLGPGVTLVCVILYAIIVSRAKNSRPDTRSRQQGITLAGLLIFTAISAGFIRWLQMQEDELGNWRMIPLFAPPALTAGWLLHIISDRMSNRRRARYKGVTLAVLLVLLTSGSLAVEGDPMSMVLVFDAVLLLTHSFVVYCALVVAGIARHRDLEHEVEVDNLPLGEM